MAAPVSMARPWTPDFNHSERERWICIYPLYLNSKKTVNQGRKIPKNKAVENPTCHEIRDICAEAGMKLGVENKVHPREVEPREARYRGRVRVQLREDDGAPMLDKFPSRKSILLYLGEMIPKLKSRQQAGGGTAQGNSQQQQTNTVGGASKKKKGKRK